MFWRYGHLPVWPGSMEVPAASVAASVQPPEVTTAEKVPVMGSPDPKKICASHIERLFHPNGRAPHDPAHKRPLKNE
jgi:hypothetical protein